MSKYLERAKALRNDPNVHYNCAQAVLMAFCEEKGLSSQMAAEVCTVSVTRGQSCLTGSSFSRATTA